MEHKRKKQWILIIMLLLTVCSVFVVYAGREWMFTNPFKPYTFSSVSYASGDGDGCTYVIDDSNRKILKISADGRLLWRACASDKSFLSAERVVADGDGNVYLHDVRIEQGVQIASEGIVKLSSKGKYISTVASVEAEKGATLWEWYPLSMVWSTCKRKRRAFWSVTQNREARKFFLLLMRRTGFCVVLMTETVIACFM